MQLRLNRTGEEAGYLGVAPERCGASRFLRLIHPSVLLLRLLFLCLLLRRYHGDDVTRGADFGCPISGTVLHESLMVLHNGC